jgi:hypothetical protein
MKPNETYLQTQTPIYNKRQQASTVGRWYMTSLASTRSAAAILSGASQSKSTTLAESKPFSWHGQTWWFPKWGISPNRPF